MESCHFNGVSVRHHPTNKATLPSWRLGATSLSPQICPRPHSHPALTLSHRRNAGMLSSLVPDYLGNRETPMPRTLSHSFILAMCRLTEHRIGTRLEQGTTEPLPVCYHRRCQAQGSTAPISLHAVKSGQPLPVPSQEHMLTKPHTSSAPCRAWGAVRTPPMLPPHTAPEAFAQGTRERGCKSEHRTARR